MRQNIAIINSVNSRREYMLQAQKNNSIYNFLGSQGRLNWLQGEYAYLSVNGLSGVLRRLGIKHDIVREDSVKIEDLRYYNLIFIPNACKLSRKLINMLLLWLKTADGLFVSGKSNLPLALLGLSEYKTYRPQNYIGIQWKENLPLSPPGYEIARVKPAPKTEALGSVVEYADEGLNELQLDIPALIKNGKIAYVPAPVFEFVGGLLQGHVDIEPLRGFLGRESNFYIDKICVFIKSILEKIGFYKLCYAKVKPWGRYDRVFVLRHDTDGSSDDTYFNYEITNKIPATYSVLFDDNRNIWASRILKVPFLEYAYHFRTNRDGPFFKLLKKTKIIHSDADKTAITKKGLLRQVQDAQRKCKLEFKTLQRHFGYFFYPETLDAMRCLYNKQAKILGMGTMFRFTNIRYGDSPRKSVYTVSHPDTSVPFWFPFKLAISALEYCQTLRGWDMTSLIEPNLELIDLVFENSRHLSNGVYTFGFHPAHARGKKFNANGNYPWFLYSLEKARENNWWIANCQMVYQKLNDWEDILFRFDNNLITLYNPTDRNINNIFIGFDLKIKALERISDIDIEILHPELLSISEVKPQEEIKFKVIT